MTMRGRRRMSKEIFEKNLKAMEKWYPDFATAIRKKIYEKDDLEVETETSQDGELIFKVKKDNRILYLNGKRNAKEPVQIWMERIGEIHKYATVILVGVGSGRYLKKIIENTDSTVNILVYEPSITIFLKLLEEVDLSREIEDRPIAFVIEGMNEKGLDSIIGELVSIESIEFLKQEIHPNYQELFPEKTVHILRRVENRISEFFTNYNSGALFAAHLAKNQMQNMRFVCDGYNTKTLCRAIPHDRPAILVAAGPSLNDNIKDLKKAKNKAFILAVDTAMKPLLKAGIIPDAFITIDAKKPMNLVEIDAAKDIPIIAPITANYDILKEQRGKKIFYFDGYMLSQSAYMIVGKFLPDVSTGGSVACSGFSLLYKMGFDQIILVGQDLAYTNNKSHADGTFQDVMPHEETEGMIRVKGNYEETVPTIANLKMYLDWFKMYIEGAKKHRNTLRVINATAGGAYIEGTELMTLQEAIERTCDKEVNFSECIQNMKSEFTQEERKKVVEYLHTIPKELDTIQKNAKELKSTYHKIYKMCDSGNISNDGYLKLLKKVKKLSKKCECNEAYELISSTMPVAEMIVKSESLYELDTFEEEGKAISKQGMRYSSMMEECAKILKEFAEETLLPLK